MGVVQGLTEFLPISSSGHLALARELFGAGPAADLGFEVASHGGTLLAVLIFYRLKLLELAGGMMRGGRSGLNYLFWIIVGTIPAGLVGLTFKDTIETLFNNIQLVGFAWLFTAAMLTVGERFGRPHLASGEVGIWRALAIGVSQAVAILPGVSRSGSTIATGMLAGVEKRTAVDFSFILSIPAILGAIVLTLNDWANSAVTFEWADAAGFIAAGVTGYGAIVLLLRVVSTGRLRWFAAYCAVMGMAAIFFG